MRVLLTCLLLPVLRVRPGSQEASDGGGVLCAGGYQAIRERAGTGKPPVLHEGLGAPQHEHESRACYAGERRPQRPPCTCSGRIPNPLVGPSRGAALAPCLASGGTSTLSNPAGSPTERRSTGPTGGPPRRGAPGDTAPCTSSAWSSPNDEAGQRSRDGHEGAPQDGAGPHKDPDTGPQRPADCSPPTAQRPRSTEERPRAPRRTASTGECACPEAFTCATLSRVLLRKGSGYASILRGAEHAHQGAGGEVTAHADDILILHSDDSDATEIAIETTKLAEQRGLTISTDERGAQGQGPFLESGLEGTTVHDPKATEPEASSGADHTLYVDPSQIIARWSLRTARRGGLTVWPLESLGGQLGGPGYLLRIEADRVLDVQE